MQVNLAVFRFVPFRIEKKIFGVQQFLDFPRVVFRPIGDCLNSQPALHSRQRATYKGMIVGHLILIHPFRDFVLPVIFNVPSKPVRSIKCIWRGSPTLLASLRQVLFTIRRLGQLLKHQKAREADSTRKAALEDGLRDVSIDTKDRSNDSPGQSENDRGPARKSQSRGGSIWKGDSRTKAIVGSDQSG